MRIGIFGPAFAGKSTVAKSLRERLSRSGRDMRVTSFAAPIYEIAATMFNMEGKDRSLLQAVGMKMREIDEDVWVNAVLRKGDNLIVDDGRFLNEASILKRNGFFMVRLVLTGEGQLDRCKSMYGDDWQRYKDELDHVSEKQGAMISSDIFDIEINAGRPVEEIIDEIMYNLSETKSE